MASERLGWGIRVAIAVISVAVAAIVLALFFTAEKPIDFLTPLIALLAFGVSALALFQTRRSSLAADRNAKIAELQEKRRRYGWAVERHPDGRNLVLRNTGTLRATNVKLAGEFAHLEFLIADGPVTIDPGEARAFNAVAAFQSRGEEVTIQWLPEGKDVVRSWTEVIPPEPRDPEGNNARRERERETAAQEARTDLRRHVDLLLRLAVAYAHWQAHPDDLAARLEAESLVVALPPYFVKEIGFELDVPRDDPSPTYFPYETMFGPESQDEWELVKDRIGELELLWNIRRLIGYDVRIKEAGPRAAGEYRFEDMVDGYVRRVRERRDGPRPTRMTAQEERQRAEAKQHLAEMRRMMGDVPEAEDLRSVTDPGVVVADVEDGNPTDT